MRKSIAQAISRTTHTLPEVIRYVRLHRKNFLIKTVCFICAFNFLVCVCAVDSFESCGQFLFMAVNGAILVWAGYANGVIS